MHLIWFVLSPCVALVGAQNLAFVKSLPLRIIRKGIPFTNTTSPESFPNTITVSSSLSNETDSSISSTFALPYTFPTAPNSAQYTNSTTDASTCTGSVTYYGSVPPTVYLTVTEDFTVTVTASNVSVTETPILITPLPACQATVLPLVGTLGPQVFTSAKPAAKSGHAPDPSLTGEIPGYASPQPGDSAAPPLAPLPLASLAPEASNPVYSSVGYTSTVIVTKKTPVTVVTPPSTSPDVNFQYPTHTSSTSATGPSGNNGGNDDGKSSSNDSGNNSAGNSAITSVGSNPAPSSRSNNNGDVSTQPASVGPSLATSSPVIGSAWINGNGAATTSTPDDVPPATTKLGNIIASVINSRFATASATGGSPALPFTTTIGSLPIIVLPSSVVVGAQTVAIPTSAPITIGVNGATVTVRPSEIIALGTTITISPIQQDKGTATSAPTSTIVTAVGQVTFTIGPTVAIISETTYRIGQGAPTTTITVGGTPVSLGSNGVGLPRTTLNPSGVTPAPFVVYTVEGLTVSVDNSEAVLGGITYRIGSDAPRATTTIESRVVSFGPAGVGLKSTTIAPTAAHTSGAQSDMNTLSAATSSATQHGTLSNGSSAEMKTSSLRLLASCLLAMPCCWPVFWYVI